MTAGGPARVIGWSVAGVVSAALLSGAALALTLTHRPDPTHLFLTPEPAPPADISIAALADPAPVVVDEAPDQADPEPSADDPLPSPPVADTSPTRPEGPALAAPPPEVPVQADLSIPEPAPKPAAKPAEAKPEKKPKPQKAKRKDAPAPKKAETKSPEKNAASAASSAPKSGAKAKGGKKTSPAAYAKAVMKKVRATSKKSGAGKGTVDVGFSIADNGGLAGVSILQSSGNAALDKLAADHIRRSAPFPAPPEGAGTSYSFEFVGK